MTGFETRQLVVNGVRSPVLVGGSGAAGETVVFVWVNRVAEHLLRAGTKHAVLRLYRSTRLADMDALVEPLRNRDPETLVVFGATDVYIPVEQAERRRRVFPRARVEILPGVGHWAWLEQPDRVAGFVIPFLRERVGMTAQKTN